MRTISEVLDRAKTVQKVHSDYKLALCLGIGESSLSAYRNGRGLPDEKTCQKLAVAMGEDPIILMVEIHAQRVKDDDSRAMWTALAKRLQKGVANVVILSLIAIFSLAASALPAQASTVSPPATSSSLYIMLSTANRAVGLFSHYFVKIRKFLRNLGQAGNFSHI